MCSSRTAAVLTSPHYIGVGWTAALAKKYYQVMQRYYVQYMSGYDADVLNQLIQVCICVHMCVCVCVSWPLVSKTWQCQGI